MNWSKKKIEPFSEVALTILISIVTLLLQLISFATTWSGSKVYLEGVFPYASLLFAVAIQTTAYFFSNSLRNRVSVLKVTALLVAICCSTYYSYIGIYNSVNSPVRFLQERYVQIREELTEIYETDMEEKIGFAREAIDDAASEITAGYAALSEAAQNVEACREALSEKGNSYATGMSAPRQSAYENYEDYVAAYNTYVAGISTGNTTEEKSARNRALAAYGFGSIEELQEAERQNASALSALGAALGVTEAQGYSQIPDVISDIHVNLLAAIDETMRGTEFGSTEQTGLNRLFQAAKVCGYQGCSASEISGIIKQSTEAAGKPLMADYSELVVALEGGHVTDANTMELKNAMDAEILAALLRMNSLLQPEKQISYSEERYEITDLYLIPIQALKDSTTRMTALFCLGVAALIDMLSVLFAVSLRRRKPLWRRHTLLLGNQEDYIPQIYASLPLRYHPIQALSEFLGYFMPSPETESDGYMMSAEMDRLEGYYPLVALLCQINMAKLVPVGLFENEKEILLLKAKFVFWANSVIYEERNEEKEASA